MLLSKPAYLGLLILVLSKILMYQFWYEYVKPNSGENQKCVLWIQTCNVFHCIHKNRRYL